MNLDFMVFEKGVIKGWLMRDRHTVNDISVWTLLNHNIFSENGKNHTLINECIDNDIFYSASSLENLSSKTNWQRERVNNWRDLTPETNKGHKKVESPHHLWTVGEFKKTKYSKNRSFLNNKHVAKMNLHS